MKISIQSFKGIAPRINPRYLPDGASQTALNVKAFGQDLRPINNLSATVATLTKSGNLQTIYRFGQDLDSENQHWFSWPFDVDVCRGQISGDTSEWTFYTGDGFPKATYSALALSGTSTALPVLFRRLGLPTPEVAPKLKADNPEAEGVKPAVFLGLDRLALINPEIGLKVSIDGGATYEETGPIANNTADTVAAALNGLEACDAEVLGAGVLVTASIGGEGVTLIVRWGETSSDFVSATGSKGDRGLPETRVYVWTWVAIEAGLAMESGPSPASDPVEVYPGGTVELSGLPPIPSGFTNITYRRVYRSVAGVYLYVGDILASETSDIDDVPAEALGEAMPSMMWAMPPDDLKGLINLPNGMMAGFIGRDVYFCDPYRPYAWPESYIQSIDYPVVGLGRMDTTLAVLTKGNPYFMQGASPEVITVVKSDIEQACVSKRSIVSIGGAVIYASPDGLVMLSSSGSRVLTAERFERGDWQALFSPTTIHAYGHDNRYVAFSSGWGFIYDLATGELVLHDIPANGGYTEPRMDVLFILDNAKQIRKWDGGTVRTGTYFSKTHSLSEITGFSCAQVEAEAYPVETTVYVDGTAIFTKTVTSRTPFRIPPIPGRDWEIGLVTEHRVFNVVLAQSMAEIASA